MVPVSAGTRVVVFGVQRIADRAASCLVSEGVRRRAGRRRGCPTRQRSTRGVQRRGGRRIVGTCVSSKSNAWQEIPLTSAASVPATAGCRGSWPAGPRRADRALRHRDAGGGSEAPAMARPRWSSRHLVLGAAHRRVRRGWACGTRSQAGSASRRKSGRRSPPRYEPCNLYNRNCFRITDSVEQEMPVAGVSRALAAFAAAVRILDDLPADVVHITLCR